MISENLASCSRSFIQDGFDVPLKSKKGHP